MSTYEFNPLTRELDLVGDGSGASISVPVSIANGGTASATRQAAIDALTASSSGTERQVLQVSSSSATFANLRLPEYTSDPTPASGDVWVLRSGSGGTDGIPLGMLLALTQNVGATTSYQLSYRTSEGSTVRATLA